MDRRWIVPVLAAAAWWPAAGSPAAPASATRPASTARALTGPGAEGVRKILKASGVPYEWDAKNHLGMVAYKDLAYAASKTVLVFANNDAHGRYLKVTLLLLDKGKDYPYSGDLLRSLLEASDSGVMVHLEMVPGTGRIFASAWLDLTDLTPRVFKDTLTAVALTGDRWAKGIQASL